MKTLEEMSRGLAEIIRQCDEDIEFLREFQRQEELRKWEHEHNQAIERGARTA
ncbi:hypothetical protein [Paenibacillus sp. GYB003]|uniref:hypothetical protein n=1 Tax=Paenibacillus sp. GYB003 TaxID=2994392 RepID=UPI002F963279